MPRNYIRKTTTKYSQKDLENAIAEVKSGAKSLLQAAKDVVPKSTIYDHVSGKNWKQIGKGNFSDHFGSGRPKIDDTVEKYLVQGVIYLGKIGWPLQAKDIATAMKIYLDSGNQVMRFAHNTPGKDWVYDFMKRLKNELSMCMSKLVTIARAKGLKKETLEAFFKMLTEFFSEIRISLADDASRIYNLDKTRLNLEPTKRKFLYHILQGLCCQKEKEYTLSWFVETQMESIYHLMWFSRQKEDKSFLHG